VAAPAGLADVAHLPAMDVAGRIPRLQAALGAVAGRPAALLVTHLTNVRYLTGFTGSAALLFVPAAGDAVLVTDGRYEEQAAGEVAAAGAPSEVAIGRSVAAQRELLAARAGHLPTLALEAEHVSWADQRQYASSWFPGVELVADDGAVERLRIVKDAGEVARIEAACAVADLALATVAPLLEERPSEAGFGRALDDEVRRGAEDLSFETIVAAGPNGSRPHHDPTDRTIVAGDLVVIDFGALVDGYHSDMTRTFAVGGLDALEPEQRRMLDVVRAAQAAGVAAVGPEVPAKAVDEACRAVIAAAGWADRFVHGTGHGVGLDIHEAPAVAASADATLAPGHVVTVEPGVYLAGYGGVRIEDTVVVTPTGHRALTRAPKI
jgi:Xaa-Pro aminopeptidase